MTMESVLHHPPTPLVLTEGGKVGLSCTVTLWGSVDIAWLEKLVCLLQIKLRILRKGSHCELLNGGGGA